MIFNGLDCSISFAYIIKKVTMIKKYSILLKLSISTPRLQPLFGSIPNIIIHNGKARMKNKNGMSVTQIGLIFTLFVSRYNAPAIMIILRNWLMGMYVWSWTVQNPEIKSTNILIGKINISSRLIRINMRLFSEFISECAISINSSEFKDY